MREEGDEGRDREGNKSRPGKVRNAHVYSCWKQIARNEVLGVMGG